MNKNKFERSISYRIMYLINHYSNYQITKQTGIYENTLARLKHHDANIDNIALNTAVLLDNMALKVYKYHSKYTATKIAKDVVNVVTSHLSAYYLGEHIDVAHSILGNLRSKRSSIARLYFVSAVAIANFYEGHKSLIKRSNQHPVFVTDSMKKNVQRLINSNYSSYRVAKHTGLQPSVTSRLFRGVTNLNKTKPKTIYLLNHFYLSHQYNVDSSNPV